MRSNTIYRPQRWAIRVLQETRTEGFVPCRNGRLTDNLSVFRLAEWFEGSVNIGPFTAPETFTFMRVWWHSEKMRRSEANPRFRCLKKGEYKV